MASKTVRQNIIDSLYTIVSEMVDPEDLTSIWNNYLKDNLDDIDYAQLPAVGIEEGDEEVEAMMWPCVQKVLKVYIHFKFSVKEGLDVYNTFNYYLGIMQYHLFKDLTVGGYAYNIKEVGNAPEIIDYNDNLPGGVLMVEIYYKHRHDDPYTAL